MEAAIDRAILEKSDYEVEFRILHPSGTVRYVHAVGHPVVNASGDLVEIVGSSMDVTERKRAEALRDGESRILEMIARDAPLEEILEAWCGLWKPNSLACFALSFSSTTMDSTCGMAPLQPSQVLYQCHRRPFHRTKRGILRHGYVSQRTRCRHRHFVDPLWEPYRSVAEAYGLRACWSTPILAPSGKALGSFAMYYREPRSPSPAETRALEMATHLAGIAIERRMARAERNECVRPRRISRT